MGRNNAPLHPTLGFGTGTSFSHGIDGVLKGLTVLIPRNVGGGQPYRFDEESDVVVWRDRMGNFRDRGRGGTGGTVRTKGRIAARGQHFRLRFTEEAIRNSFCSDHSDFRFARLRRDGISGVVNRGSFRNGNSGGSSFSSPFRLLSERSRRGRIWAIRGNMPVLIAVVTQS